MKKINIVFCYSLFTQRFSLFFPNYNNLVVIADNGNRAGHNGVGSNGGWNCGSSEGNRVEMAEVVVAMVR